MRKVSELLASRPSKSHFVAGCDLSVIDAIRHLVCHNLTSLVVTTADVPVGVFSLTTLARHVAFGRGSLEGLKLSDVMSPDVAYATPDTDLLECMVMMTGYVNGTMPVLRQGKLVGFVEMREVTREVMAELNRKKPEPVTPVAPTIWRGKFLERPLDLSVKH